MLYQLYETHRALLSPFSEFASASAKLYSHPLSPFTHTPRLHEHDAAVIREYFRDMPHGAYRITKVMQAIKKAYQVKTLIRNILDFGDVETDSVGDTGRYFSFREAGKL